MAEQPIVTFDGDVLKRFKTAYDNAVAADSVDFVFEGNEFLTEYARYLIEYLEKKFA